MNVPTSGELGQRYRGMADDELLVVAAESASLTPVAAAALKQELARRGLAETDVEEASARLSELSAENEEIRKALFDPKTRLANELRFALNYFIGLILMAVGWGISTLLARALFKSPQTRTNFATGACILVGFGYSFWLIVEYIKRRRSRRGVRAAREGQRN
jgi:hypothetical protein